jgi:hypothetical protein
MMKNTSISIALTITMSIAVLSCLSQTRNMATLKHPVQGITDDSLLTLVQYQTFRYFWDGAEPVSGMTCERINMNDVYPENDKNIITTGGSGFGFMAILIGIEWGFITREQGVERLERMIRFLEGADRFHGAWPHWINGETGKVKPFSTKDDGADLVETSYMIQGMLTVRQYFANGSTREKRLAEAIDRLWKDVDFTWFTRGKDVIYWHWSPKYGWEMNFPVEGYNECLILYILGASSPTHPVSPLAYHKGWARSGDIKGNAGKYGYLLALKHNGAPEYGGPLFWAHYSYLGLDPRGLTDKYADYWEHNRNQTLINRQWCIENPKHFKGYGENCWGLTASYSVNFYAGHAPGPENDLGVISPTAAISSIPYTPEYSLEALRHFYYNLGDQIWGEYGFYDAFSIHDNWYPQQYLAIDQGPEVVMIENYRTGLLWNLFMSCPEVQDGLKKLGFSSPKLTN